MATGRRAYIVICRHLRCAAVRSLQLAVCVCCWALALTAPSSTSAAAPHAKRASSYASTPAPPTPRHQHSRCARRASFHSSGGNPGPSHKRNRHALCHGRRHRSTHPQHHARSPVSGACTNTQLLPSAANLELVRAATLCLVNRERRSHGEGALRPNGRLQTAAQEHSTDMSAGDYFEHDGPGGSTPLSRMRAAGYLFSSHVGYAVGENIAWATLWMATPKEIVAGWMASPGHRANILDATFHDSGLGVSPHPLASLARGQAGAIYTQDFGRIIAP